MPRLRQRVEYPEPARQDPPAPPAREEKDPIELYLAALAKRCSPGYVRRAARVLGRWRVHLRLAGRSVAEATTADAAGFLGALNATAETVREERRLLVGWHRWAVEQGLVPASAPAFAPPLPQGSRRKRRPRTAGRPTDATIRDLRDVVRTPTGRALPVGADIGGGGDASRYPGHALGALGGLGADRSLGVGGWVGGHGYRLLAASYDRGEVSGMPTSTSEQIERILRLCMFCHPTSVLDVGCGNGQYGFLLRCALDGLHDQRQWSTRIVGIEGFEEYLTPVQRYVYTDLWVQDIRTCLPSVPDNSFDLALLIDVIEHFSIADGLVVLEQLQRVATSVVVATPNHWINQGAMFGNEMEVHRSLWAEHSLDGGIVVPHDSQLIVLFTRDQPVARTVRRDCSRLRMREMVPAPILRAARSVRASFRRQSPAPGPTAE